MLNGDPYKMIIISDITSLVKAEYTRSLSKLSDIMIASSSHEMKTPINTTINMLNMIEEFTQDKLILYWVKIARSSTKQLIYLINDSLDFYQIKANQFNLKLFPTNIKELVDLSF